MNRTRLTQAGLEAFMRARNMRPTSPDVGEERVVMLECFKEAMDVVFDIIEPEINAANERLATMAHGLE